MKTLFKQPFLIFVVAIVAAVTLAACSNEMTSTDVPAGKPQVVAVHFSPPSTGQAETENPWQENDQVTVIPQAATRGGITFKYTKQQEGESYMWQNVLAGESNHFLTALPASFTAYFPATESTSTNAFTLPNISCNRSTEQADQSDATKLRMADYMTAPATTVAWVDDVLNLTLAHRLCRLTFIVKAYGNEFNGVVPKLEEVKIRSQNRTVGLIYEKDEVRVETSGNPVWISPLIVTDDDSGNPIYTAIVTPCKLVSDETELMSLTVNNTSLPVRYKGSLTDLASGNTYAFHLKVGKDYVTISGVSSWPLSGWYDETEL